MSHLSPGNRNVVKVVSVCLCLGLAVVSTRAASLLLDFGPTVTTAPSNLLSMAHFAGAVSATETSWNTVTADTSSLVYSDGTTASGVSVELGRSDVGVSSTVNFNNNSITSSALGGQETAGIYTNTSPIRDGVFATGTATVNTNAIGLRINGLAAGSYTVYISGRNTSTAVTAPERFFCTNGASATTFSFSTNTTSWVDEANSGTTPGFAPNPADAITSAFAYGDNCVLLSVTLGAGESLYLAAIGAATNEFRGFLNAVEIVPGSPVLTNFPPFIGRQPSGATVYEGATVSLANVKYAGLPQLLYQWRFNGTNIAGATNSTITLSNITASVGGTYTVAVTNSIGYTLSSNAVVTVVPLFNTGQMTNIWNLLPGERFYITVTNNTSGERGLAYNPATTNLLLVSQLPSNNIVVLDAATGAERHFMNLSGVPSGAAGINMVGVAADGAVYVGNVTANAGSPSTPYILSKWSNDDASSTPAQLLSGDPGFNTTAIGLRWGDNLVVRGAGSDTQILIGPGSGTNVCLFTTADGNTFTPNILTISGVPSGFAQFGISFGPGTNTFWAKTINQELYLVEYDFLAATGAVVQAYGTTNGVPNTFRFISTDASQKWMAGVMAVATGLPDNVRLYNISNLTNGPVLADQELYSTQNPNTFLNGAGTGSTSFGGDYVFALDSQNGIKAFLINTNFAPLDPFDITSIASPSVSTVVLTWQSVAGHSYQVQARSTISDTNWSNEGSPITASGTTTSVTNNVPGQTRFYRVRGQ